MKAHTPTIAFFSSLLLPILGIEPPSKVMPIPPSNLAQDHAEEKKDLQPLVPNKTLDAVDQQTPQSNQVAPPFAGMNLAEVPEELAMHLGLEPNQGALVRLVAPDSPAQKAGIQPYDIVQSVGGKQIRGHDCLCAVLKKHSPGDEVEVSLIRRGENISQKMILGQRPEGLALETNPDKCDDPTEKLFRNIPERFAPEVRKLLDQNLRALGKNPSDALLQLRNLEMEKLRQQADQALDQMMQMQPRLDNMDLNQKMLDLIPEAAKKMTMSMHSKVSIIDENGRIELLRNSDSTEARVYDKDGVLEWSGPFATEEDKNNIPENTKKRLEKLNLQQDQAGDIFGNGFHQHLKSGK